MRQPRRAVPALPLAVTMGEPAGIGGEITLKAWAAARALGLPPFFVIDSPKRLQALAERIGLAVPVRAIASPEEALELFPTHLPVLAEEPAVAVAPGRPDPANASAVARSIERAVALTQAGQAGAVVTNPIHKGVLYAAGFPHPGHTEFLAALAGPEVVPVMMLACRALKVVPVTIHVSLRRAIETLSADTIVALGRITAQALRQDFGIRAPRLAVAGLNPHAGEDGAMGMEDIRIVAPAVERLRAEGIDAFGPLPSDTMFHARARAQYDAALCMYHDQALIPIKTLDFDRGVNVTLGLPFVRTSPDHGTAFAIAGTGQAREGSLAAALKMAESIRRHRARKLPERGRAASGIPAA